MGRLDGRLLLLWLELRRGRKGGVWCVDVSNVCRSTVAGKEKLGRFVWMGGWCGWGGEAADEAEDEPPPPPPPGGTSPLSAEGGPVLTGVAVREEEEAEETAVEEALAPVAPAGGVGSVWACARGRPAAAGGASSSKSLKSSMLSTASPGARGCVVPGGDVAGEAVADPPAASLTPFPPSPAPAPAAAPPSLRSRWAGRKMAVTTWLGEVGEVGTCSIGVELLLLLVLLLVVVVVVEMGSKEAEPPLPLPLPLVCERRCWRRGLACRSSVMWSAAAPAAAAAAAAAWPFMGAWTVTSGEPRPLSGSGGKTPPGTPV